MKMAAVALWIGQGATVGCGGDGIAPKGLVRDDSETGRQRTATLFYLLLNPMANIHE